MADRLILASSSPRRLDLLRSIGVEPIVEPADIDETPAGDESPEELVVRLARHKASRILAEHRSDPGAVVLAADTIVELDGSVLNKPVDATDAQQMLAAISGRTHEVLTGVAIATHYGIEAEMVRSEVTIRALSTEDIDAYIATGEPFGKAGAYAIQGYGAVFVTSISGSYHNVVGLPLHTVAELLDRLGLGLLDWVGGR